MVDVEVSDLVAQFANGIMISQSDSGDIIAVQVKCKTRDHPSAHVIDTIDIKLDRKIAAITKLSTKQTIMVAQSNVEKMIMAWIPMSAIPNERDVHVMSVNTSIGGVAMLGVSTELQGRPWSKEKKQGGPTYTPYKSFGLTMYLAKMQEIHQSFKVADLTPRKE
jgi:hypothetical protein